MSHDNPYAPGAEGQPGSSASQHASVPLEIGPIFNRSWEVFSENVGVVFGGFLLMLAPAIVLAIVGAVVQGVLQGIAANMDSNQEAILAVTMVVSLGVNFFSTAISIFLQLGFIRLVLNVVRGQDAEVGMLISQGHLFLTALGAAILVGIGVMFGLLFLIIPGIVLGLAMQFVMYLIVDRQAGIGDAISQSWSLTSPHLLNLFVINVVFGIGALVASCLTCGIGYFVVVPLVMVAQAVMYDSLLALSSDMETV